MGVRVAGAVLVAAVLVAGCGGSGKSQRTAPASGSGVSTAAAPSTAANSVLGHQFQNPVYDKDFPDPAVLRAGSIYYAYGTQGGGANIQTLTSADLVHWSPASDALPAVGRWASTGSTWAPEVLSVAGKYVMFYVAHDNKSGKQCIGRAQSGKPGGPFTDDRSTALVCQPTLGGSIDPDPSRSTDGTLYLYWKNDGNCCGQPVHLWGQQLSRDAASLTGKAVELLSNTKSWQGNLIEAPEMVNHDGKYFLFYSANDYASEKYAVGYASCQGPTGTCTDRSDRPLLSSDAAAAGPGHCFVLDLPDGSSAILFHAWAPTAIGSAIPGRQLWMEKLSWPGDQPSVAPPS